MTDAPFPALERMPGHLLRRAAQRHNALWASEVGTQPTSPQYALLRAVAAEPGLDQRRAGERASLDRSSTMDVVARLERQGWLTRTRDPRDARRDVLLPGPATADAMARLALPVARVQDALLAAVPASGRAALHTHLAAIARLDPATPEASPERIPGHLIRRAQQVHTALFAERFTPGPPTPTATPTLTGPQFALLLTLESHPGSSQAEAGAAVTLDKSTVADVADRLAERGWVERRRDPADGRRRILTLTAAGRTALAAAVPVVDGIQRTLLEPLPEAARAAFIEDLRILADAG